MKNLEPVCFAIFYNRNEWPLLLKKCLTPLIKLLKTEVDCVDYALYFSKEKGDHIRLELRLKQGASYISYQTLIETFLAEHPTTREEKTLPLYDSFFLDLPNNSLYTNIFKLHSSHSLSLASKQVSLIRMAVSDIMFDIFVDNEADQDSLFSFYLSMEIVALAVIKAPVNEVEKIVRDRYDKLSGQLSGKELLQLEYEVNKLVENNLDGLKEIFDLVAYGKYTDDTKWLTKWYQICRQMQGFENSFALFKEISMLIREHIDIHDVKWSTLNLATMNRLISNQKENTI